MEPRLAANYAADVVGFWGLMGENEAGTRGLRKPQELFTLPSEGGAENVPQEAG